MSYYEPSSNLTKQLRTKLEAPPSEGGSCSACTATALHCIHLYRDEKMWCCTRCRRYGPEAMHVITK